MNHTPHKWILDEDGEPFIYQLNKAGTNLFYLNVQDGVIDTGERTSKAQLRSIAEFIYTSCNAHEELVDVLKLCKRNVEAQLYMLPYDASEQKDILSSWIGRINGALSLATIEKGA